MAVGDVVLDIPSQVAEEEVQQAGGCDAIHIVIAENENLFSLRQRRGDSVNGCAHVPEEERIVKRFPVRFEKVGGGFDRSDPTLQQQPGDHRSNPYFFRKIFNASSFFSGYKLPLLFHEFFYVVLRDKSIWGIRNATRQPVSRILSPGGSRKDGH